MEYVQLGRSGMRVSPICLGTMSFGWTTEEEEAIQIVNEAMDLGVNFIDGADVYAAGVSEEYIGKALAQSGRRDDVVLATKAVWKMGDGPNDWGASRYHLTRAVDASLRRLQTDRIDLFYLHVPDPSTPLDEMLQVFDTLVQQGKILYVGTSKWPATLVLEFLMMAKHAGWPQTVAEQSPYNLIDRGLENELAWMCLRHGIGIVNYSPLAAGLLSGKYHEGEPLPEGIRLGPGADWLNHESFAAVEKLRPLVEAKGCTMAEYVLAWEMQKPFITSPIVGVRTVEHIRSAVNACDVEFTAEELEKIDEIVPPGTSTTPHYDAQVPVKLRTAANNGNWRSYLLVDSSPPPGQERRSI